MHVDPARIPELGEVFLVNSIKKEIVACRRVLIKIFPPLMGVR